MHNPVIVDFPLRGEWVAALTPGKKVPSHGTDAFGQRYAYDFMQTNPSASGLRFYRSSPACYLLFGVRLADCYGWGQPIYSPVDGQIILAEDGWPEPPVCTHSEITAALCSTR